MPTRPGTQPARRLAAVRSRRGASVVVLAAVAALIATGGLLSGVVRPGESVAAASPSATAGGAPASPSAALAPSAAATPMPTAAVTPGPTPVPTPAGHPSPRPSASGAASGSPGPTPTTAPTPRPAPSLDANGIPSAALQARLDAIRARLGIPGVSVAIRWDDGRQWLGASGLRDVRAGEPMTTGTAFAFASVSKTVTAAVVLQLVEEGRITLETPVAPLLPQYPVHPGITVRNLLDHTSGIPDYFLNGKIDPALQSDRAATWTPAMTWSYVAPVRKRFLPDRIWLYSNSNYLLLGELVEAVTGRTLAREVRDRILDPLGLDSAWYQVAERPRATGTRGYRLTRREDGTWRTTAVAPASDIMPFRSVVTAAAGAGSIAGTAADAARWMQAFTGGEILGPELQRRLVADVQVTRTLRARVPYGLGIQAVPIAGRYALGHSGRFVGFRNVVRSLPSEGVTIAVLTNQNAQDPSRVAERLLTLVLPPLPSPSPSPAASGQPAGSASASP